MNTLRATTHHTNQAILIDTNLLKSMNMHLILIEKESGIHMQAMVFIRMDQVNIAIETKKQLTITMNIITMMMMILEDKLQSHAMMDRKKLVSKAQMDATTSHSVTTVKKEILVLYKL